MPTGPRFWRPGSQQGKIDVRALNALIEHTFEERSCFQYDTLRQYDKFYQNVYPNLAVTPSEDAAGTVPIQAYNNATDRTNVSTGQILCSKANTWGVKHEFMTGVEYGRRFRTTLEIPVFLTTPVTPRVPFLNRSRTLR
jgi:catecholate siderophore receptor